MDGLVEAAKKEGELNVIALPPDWANYGEIIKAFADKYDIKVNSAQPDAASQDEINAATQQKGKSTAPDVFDLGQSVALANTVDVRAVQGGDVRRHPGRRSRTPTAPGSTTTAATCRSATTPPRCRRSPRVDDLLKPEYKGKVALNGDPTQAGAAFSGVHDGRAVAGRVAPTTSRRASSSSASSRRRATSCPSTRRRPPSSPARPRWSSTGTTSTPPRPRSCRRGRWSSRRTPPSPATTSRRSTRTRRIPAAARLWQEFLYSDEGQNLYLAGGARPVRADAMVAGGHHRQGGVRQRCRSSTGR